MVDSFYQHYVGHCSLSEVHLTYSHMTFRELVPPPSQGVVVIILTDFFILYFKLRDDDWDRTQDLLNNRLVY
jgi:hypothetical protein